MLTECAISVCVQDFSDGMLVQAVIPLAHVLLSTIVVLLCPMLPCCDFTPFGHPMPVECMPLWPSPLNDAILV